MKVNIALKIARQVEGDFVFINVLKAFDDKDKLTAYLRNAQIPATEVVNGIGCVVSTAAFEDVEIE
jgi:hypothetical protein